MEDLIRRSDAVAILEDLQKDHLQFCLIPFRQAIERVQAIPSAESTGDLDNAIYEYVKEGLMDNPYDRPQGEWIPCSERLPSEQGQYLVTFPLCNEEPWVYILSFNKGKFYETDDEWDYVEYDDVTAWMPLPKPWKGADDGEDIQSADE